MINIIVEQRFDENGHYIGGVVNSTDTRRFDVVRVSYEDAGRVQIDCYNKNKEEINKDYYGFGAYGPYIREKTPKEKALENKLVESITTHISNVVIFTIYKKKEGETEE